MKRLIIFLLLVILGLQTYAQIGWEVNRNKQTEISDNPYTGYSSNEVFNKINSILTDYSIEAKDKDVTNMKVLFVYPDLKFSFTTTSTRPSDAPFKKSCKEELCCPIESTSVENRDGIVVFSSPKGLDYRYGDKHTIIGRYVFIMSPFLSEDLTAAIQQFFKAVKSENFQGSYGITMRSSSTNSSVSLPNKYNGSRYSISYPTGWSYIEDVQGADVYIGANDGSVALTILSFPTPYSLDEVMEEANANAVGAGWKKTNTSITLCGVKCYKSTLTFTYNGMPVKQLEYTLKKNGYVYNLRFGNDATKVNANLSLISSIANSFNIR